MTVLPRIYHNIAIHTQKDGRWSWTDPPLAQVPIDLLDIYVPDPDWSWLYWDHDQIETRIHAAMAHDTPFLEAFAKGWDVHLMSYCDIFGQPYPPQLVNPIHAKENTEWLASRRWTICHHEAGKCGKDDPRRHFGKTFGHRMCKGGKPENSGTIPAAKTLGLKTADLVRAANAWMSAHPAIGEYHRKVERDLRERPETRTWRGRRRRYLGPARHMLEEALAHIDQAGTQDIENAIILEIKATYKGDVRLGICRHDSQTWAVRKCRWLEIVPKIKRIAQQAREIQGTKVAFPASFKEVWAGGDKNAPCGCGRCSV